MESQVKADRALAQRLAVGERAALAKAYDQYAPMVYSVGYRLLGTHEQAEDLVQDVFLGLQRAVRTYGALGAFGGWLRRVATRAALMKLRQERAERHSMQRHGWQLRTSGGSSVEEDLTLEAAILQLTPALRAVFVLKEIEGYSYDDITELLGIEVGAAKVRLHRARRALQKSIRNQ